MAKNQYNADAIEVLSGLEPVKRRPGMYTDTTRPNHLAQEVIDNSVDEALAGHASAISVTLHADGSLSVRDNGRGMPTDKHPEHGVSGVELILTRLHAGGKFSGKNYQFSGGLHGVGVSVVNALSSKLEVTVYRDRAAYQMAFADGAATSRLKKTGTAKADERGTLIRFWPDGRYFDYPRFSTSKLLQSLKAKAVLCKGLHIDFQDQINSKQYSWCYADGLSDYLLDAIGQLKATQWLPAAPFVGDFSAQDEAVSWALLWSEGIKECVVETYVNLIPTQSAHPPADSLLTQTNFFMQFTKQSCAERFTGLNASLGKLPTNAFLPPPPKQLTFVIDNDHTDIGAQSFMGVLSISDDTIIR